MSFDVSELFAFVAARSAEETQSSVDFCRSVESGALPGPGLEISPESLLQHGESKLRGHQAVEQMLATTIRPYLGHSGEAGQNAEQQLRLLAVQYDQHRDYRPQWRPGSPEYPRLAAVPRRPTQQLTES
ncbi:DUF6221 family protein [Streptacidiphilus anmyonensis]|uniref:DUF6221 family protein n=1 Tax=Streptacidiphilus anmyonensis TaxID=405782 RepID=UPI000AA80CA4|nr:DUF6221 family protein [Streptacidiphilus anmyonensis]